VSRARRIAIAALLCALAYVAVASIAFAFRHPELTETQRLIRTADALAWR
jgi:hypothetical protein